MYIKYAHTLRVSRYCRRRICRPSYWN